MSSAFRFVHAADFHLNRPLAGLSEVPEHLAGDLSQAPFEAAERAFDLALTEKVDFMLLAGDVTDSSLAGPRELSFLQSQFRRLEEAGIAVYWSSGPSDGAKPWPKEFPLPANVVLFSPGAVEAHVHKRGSKGIASICGGDYDNLLDITPAKSVKGKSPFCIVVTHGCFSVEDISGAASRCPEVGYWASGGRPRMQVLDLPGTVFAYPGTPQARSFREPGAHGCLLVRVSDDGTIEQQFCELDAVRYTTKRVPVPAQQSRESLHGLLAEQCAQLRAMGEQPLRLVTWKLINDSYDKELYGECVLREVLRQLREDFGAPPLAIWSAGIQLRPPESFAEEWEQEDTLLGEYLKAAQALLAGLPGSLDLSSSACSSSVESVVEGISEIAEESRPELVRLAMLAGVEYLARDPDRERTAFPTGIGVSSQTHETQGNRQ